MAAKKASSKKAPQRPTKAAAATKKTAKQTKATKAPAASASKPVKASTSGAAKPIPELKPGWMSRVFGIETARLVACDATWDGTNWQRGETFTFLYRSRRAKFFVLHDMHKWTHIGTT